MSFPFHCTTCPMKFTTEEDLQIHGQVHAEGSYASNYDLDSNTEPLFNEFLTAFFPNLNDFYIPALNDFSVSDNRDSLSDECDDPSNVSSSDDDVTYTTLTDVKIPYNVSENLESKSSNAANPQRSIKSAEIGTQNLSQPDRNLATSNTIIKKLPSTVRLLNPGNIHTAQVFHQGPFATNFLKPVYIARHPSDAAMFQQRYEDDRMLGYPQCHTSILRPAVLTKYLPNIATVNLQTKSMSSVNISVPEQREVMNTATPVCFDVAEEDPNKAVVVTKNVLKRSRRSTIGVKPYSCEVCGKRFAFVKKFIAHKRIHTVGKLFSCYLCHRRFGYSYKLNQHMRLHAAQNFEKCDLCKKTYKNLGHLKRHRCKGISKKIIHRKINSSYSCTVCHRTFGRINYLNLHKRCHEDKNPWNQTQEQFLPIESLNNPLE